MAAGGLLGTVLLAVAAACTTSGCSTLATLGAEGSSGSSRSSGSLGYFAQAAAGHIDLLQRSRPVADWVADPATPTALRDRLLLSQRLRDFAISELKLPDNRSYRQYADLQRTAVVWNTVAAPELSLTLKTWCFPVVGCVGYRGYFTREPADALAAQLQAGGWETHVYGVPAYSTLGRTDWLGGDPLLNTFLNWPEGELARLIFHELAHQVAYADDDTTFNESFATAVERIGGQRWLDRHTSPAEIQEYQALESRRQDFRELTGRYRDALQALYASNASEAKKRTDKAVLMSALRAEYLLLKVQRWNGFAGYDGWFARANNATLGVTAAYNDLVPEFERLFERSGGDFSRFFTEVKILAALPKPERRAKLGAPE